VKLRLSRSGLRLRLNGDDISKLALGRPVSEPTWFPDGLFECTLTMAAQGVGASLTERGIAVTIPTGSLGDLEAGSALSAELPTPGEALFVLIEKDRRPQRP
jgi:hypothetical protein